MPLYFFNTHVAGDVIPDDEGEELRDPDHAWDCLLYTSPSPRDS